MLLMTGNTRSGGVGQGRASFARRVAVGAQRRALTDAGAEGIRPPMQMACIFNKFTRSNRRVYAEHPLNACFSS